MPTLPSEACAIQNIIQSHLERKAHDRAAVLNLTTFIRTDVGAYQLKGINLN